MWSVAESQARFNPIYMKAVGVSSILFFGLCSVYGIVKMLDTRPGLIIDSQGIVDNSSAISAGRVFWREMIAVRVAEISGQRFVVIDVVDPMRFDAGANFLHRMLNAANRNYTGSPINISSNSLQVTFDELVRMISQSFEANVGSDLQSA
jgi:hypothetical protein